MTRDELRTAIEFGQYTDAKVEGRDMSSVKVNGQYVSIDRRSKKAYFTLLIDITDEAVRKITERSLENSINDKRTELAALEIQYKELVEGGK